MSSHRDALFDSQNLTQLVGRLHGLSQSRRFNPTVVDPEHIGRVADEYAKKGITDSDEDAFVSRAVVSWGSRLLYTIQRYGFTFEEVCDVSEISIARAVAELTPDLRLSAPKRHQQLRSTLVVAALPLQMIKLAELRAWSEAARRFGAPLYEAHADTIRRWVDEARDLLPAFTRLQESYYFRSQLTQIEADLTKAGRPVCAAERPSRK